VAIVEKSWRQNSLGCAPNPWAWQSVGGMTVTKTKKAQGTRSGSKARSFAEPPWNVILHSSGHHTTSSSWAVWATTSGGL
jgi:hypothetical protein